MKDLIQILNKKLPSEKEKRREFNYCLFKTRMVLLELSNIIKCKDECLDHLL